MRTIQHDGKVYLEADDLRARLALLALLATEGSVEKSEALKAQGKDIESDLMLTHTLGVVDCIDGLDRAIRGAVTRNANYSTGGTTTDAPVGQYL